MVENTVEKVLAAEKAADEVVRAARLAAERRASDAAGEREADRKEALDAAKAAGDALRARARKEAEAICAEAQTEADKTARVLSTMALARGDDVLAAVLDEIRK